ncbi:MAG TPA: NAD-dependent epimerase/dehydratase family protein [Gaiellales bacterium]|jgi:dTDP-glucose 4,6-dehydratase/UDP-glucuronate decarboxylase
MDEGRAIIDADLGEILGRLGARLESLSGGRVLITGAAGFLAAYIVDAIARANSEGLISPRCRLQLLLRSAPDPSGRLAGVAGRPDVDVIVADVNAGYLLDPGLTHIVHAASAASPGAFRSDPIGTALANTAALQRLLEHARGGGVRSVLFFSSSEVYGDPDPAEIPTPETCAGRVDFTGPRACYAESKRFGETLCALYHAQHDVPVKVVRPFHVHGPGLRLDDGRIVVELIRQGLRQGALELLSDGRATRCYGYVADATVGFLLALTSEHDGLAFNIGADAPETSILELAATIAGVLQLPAPAPAVTPLPEHLRGAPNRSCPDLTRARRLLGYAPQTSLEDGLRRTVDWFRAREAPGPV